VITHNHHCVHSLSKSKLKKYNKIKHNELFFLDCISVLHDLFVPDFVLLCLDYEYCDFHGWFMCWTDFQTRTKVCISKDCLEQKKTFFPVIIWCIFRLQY